MARAAAFSPVTPVKSMRYDTISHPVPWNVAEKVCHAIVRSAPSSVYVIGDPDGRIGYTIECLLADPETTWPCVYADALVDEICPGTDTLVWVGDGLRSEKDAWDELCSLARYCEGTVICADPIHTGVGIGVKELRRLDPNLEHLSSYEVPDGRGDNRDIEAWETPMRWSIAQVAAWRFQSGAEQARETFLSKLSDLSAVELGQACEEILQRWPSGHEVLSLALLAAAEQGQPGEASKLMQRIETCSAVSDEKLLRLRRELKGFGQGFWRATAKDEAQRYRRDAPANGRGSKNAA